MKNSICHRVQYYETDRMDVVHHSNYIRWMEEARLEYMRLNGVDYVEIEYSGIQMPVVNIVCSYRSSAKFGDVAETEVTLTGYNGIRMEFSYRTFIQGTDILLIEGKSEHCFIDENSRLPVNLKKRMPEQSNAIYNILKNTENQTGGCI